MADQVVIPCPKCGKVSQFKQTGLTQGSGTVPASCPNCHKTVFLEVKQGKIVGAH